MQKANIKVGRMNSVLITALMTIVSVMSQTPNGYAQPQNLEHTYASPFQERSSKQPSPVKSEVISKVIPIQFAKAEELIKLINNKNGLNILSPSGKLAVDTRTNSLLVQETEDRLTALEAFISIIDIPIKQVEIEARIVTVSESKTDDLGVRWGLSFVNNGVKLSDNITHNHQQARQEISPPINVDLAATTPHAASIALQIAKLGSGVLLDLELSALQAEAVANIISSPKVITTEKAAAYIEQGTEIPYLEAASSGATSVSFRKAVLSLEVTPQITPDDQIILALNVTQDRPGHAVKAGEGEAVAIDTQRLSTHVLVNNGETLVLGGIYQYTLQTRTERVPFLADLPWIGKLFESHYQNSMKNELLIFVTPNIVKATERIET